eukprot:318667-Pyramimonas_sp.AAC.1
MEAGATVWKTTEDQFVNSLCIQWHFPRWNRDLALQTDVARRMPVEGASSLRPAKRKRDHDDSVSADRKRARQGPVEPAIVDVPLGPEDREWTNIYFDSTASHWSTERIF